MSNSIPLQYQRVPPVLVVTFIEIGQKPFLSWFWEPNPTISNINGASESSKAQP